jgi:anti-sigma regulatory factor (Ser/Thr protein kinase)
VSVFCPGETKPHSGYRHEALLWHGSDEFLDAAVPFVLEGVAGGQPVMVAVVEPRLALLQDALDGRGTSVRFVDMAVLGRNPARIIAAWRDFIEEQGAEPGPMRGIGEPIWAGRRPEELQECQLHEALLNQAIEPEVPLWLLCPYDAEALDPGVLGESWRSHPSGHGSEWVDSASYGGSHHVGELFGMPLPEPETLAPRIMFDRHDLGMLRGVVSRLAGSCDVAPRAAADLVLAVHEIASNSVIHGGGGGVLRWWSSPDAVVVEVRDLGHITDPMVGRVPPSPQGAGGRGLWLTNQLCDLVQVRSGTWGTCVRIHHWR